MGVPDTIDADDCPAAIPGNDIRLKLSAIAAPMRRLNEESTMVTLP
jgi:hypothetical protein